MSDESNKLTSDQTSKVSFSFGGASLSVEWVEDLDAALVAFEKFRSIIGDQPALVSSFAPSAPKISGEKSQEELDLEKKHSETIGRFVYRQDGKDSAFASRLDALKAALGMEHKTKKDVNGPALPPDDEKAEGKADAPLPDDGAEVF